MQEEALPDAPQYSQRINREERLCRQVLMPALSPTMEEGKLAKWIKSEGDKVAPGDVIAEIETDKATMEIEAVEEGRLGRILVPAGTEGVKVNTPIAVILIDGEEAATVTNGYAGKAPSPLPLSREGRGERATEDGTSSPSARPAPSPLAGEGGGRGATSACL